jgi:hypothetical protein
MSNGRLASPSATSVKPLPAERYRPKSMECTFCPDETSTPRGTVEPLATGLPPEFLSSHGSAVVAVVTRVAFFGPSGR